MIWPINGVFHMAHKVTIVVCLTTFPKDVRKMKISFCHEKEH
jgi:hypothetical protein